MTQTKNGCQFDRAWIGPCDEPKQDPEGTFCKDHLGVLCSCGEQAFRECDQTMGAFVCGAKLCKDARHEGGFSLRHSHV